MSWQVFSSSHIDLPLKSFFYIYINNNFLSQRLLLITKKNLTSGWPLSHGKCSTYPIWNPLYELIFFHQLQKENSHGLLELLHFNYKDRKIYIIFYYKFHSHPWNIYSEIKLVIPNFQKMTLRPQNDQKNCHFNSQNNSKKV